MIRSASHSPQYGRPFQRGTARPKPHIELRNTLSELADINALVNRSISELRNRLDQLELSQAESTNVPKAPSGPNLKTSGIFEVGDTVRILTTGRIRKRGNLAKVIKVGKRVSAQLLTGNQQKTTRKPSNLECYHDE